MDSHCPRGEASGWLALPTSDHGVGFSSHWRPNSAHDSMASVTQSDAHQTGDQKVTGSIPASFVEIDYEIYFTVNLLLLVNHEGQLSVSGE